MKPRILAQVKPQGRSGDSCLFLTYGLGRAICTVYLRRNHEESIYVESSLQICLRRLYAAPLGLLSLPLIQGIPRACAPALLSRQTVSESSTKRMHTHTPHLHAHCENQSLLFSGDLHCTDLLGDSSSVAGLGTALPLNPRLAH